MLLLLLVGCVDEQVSVGLATPSAEPVPTTTAQPAPDPDLFELVDAGALVWDGILQVEAYGGCAMLDPGNCETTTVTADQAQPELLAAIEAFDPGDLEPLVADDSGEVNDAIDRGCDSPVDGVDYAYTVKLPDGRAVRLDSCTVYLPDSGPLGAYLAAAYGV